MKILITGGTGFLGRHLVWRMAAEGWDVIFTGRQQKAAAEVIVHSPVPVRWVPIEHGSQDAEKILLTIAKDCDAVVHNAALSSPWGARTSFVRANVISTQEVINACEIMQVKRLIHISTPSLYFNFTDRLNVREDGALPNPVNEYARTKADAEKLVAAATLPYRVILRPRAIFGPWDNTLMPRLLRVIERGPIPLMRGGKAMLDLTYVDNVVDAIWLSLTRPLQQPVSTYNITNGEPQRLELLLTQVANAFEFQLRTRKLPWTLIKSIASLLETYAQLTKGPEPLLTRYGAGVLAFSQTLDISAIRNDLGYQPRVTLAEGIQRHAQWWRTHMRPAS